MILFKLLGMSPIFLFWGGLGLVLHFLKTWYAATARNEAFFKKQTYLFYAINALTTFAMIGIGDQLPTEVYVPSRIGSLMMGLSSSSILAGFMKVKVPFELLPEDKKVLNITKDILKEDTP